MPTKLKAAVDQIQIGFDENPALFDLKITPENKFKIFDQFLPVNTDRPTLEILHQKIDEVLLSSTDQLLDAIVDHLKVLQTQGLKQQLKYGLSDEQLDQQKLNDRQMFTTLMNQRNHTAHDLYYPVDAKILTTGQFITFVPMTFKDLLKSKQPR